MIGGFDPNICNLRFSVNFVESKRSLYGRNLEIDKCNQYGYQLYDSLGSVPMSPT